MRKFIAAAVTVAALITTAGGLHTPCWANHNSLPQR
jgi:hypothetical protein